MFIQIGFLKPMGKPPPFAGARMVFQATRSVSASLGRKTPPFGETEQGLFGERCLKKRKTWEDNSNCKENQHKRQLLQIYTKWTCYVCHYFRHLYMKSPFVHNMSCNLDQVDLLVFRQKCKLTR